jgi:hypothetical protein
MTQRIVSLLILPPLAVARLGASDTPLEAFEWREDPTIHGDGRTVIAPAVTLAVQRDGSVFPYVPGHLRFKDGGLYRPVAPFFELWVVLQGEGANTDSPAPAKSRPVPLTHKLLRDMGGSLEGVAWVVSVANLKAARRTGDLACGFSAEVRLHGDQLTARPLLAWSPRAPGGEPLVLAERPILLGHAQVIRPIVAQEMGVDLDVLRLRYTPAAGEVYGPPSADTGPAPGTMRDHLIVRQENRILNPNASWISYDADYARFDNPEPSDTYDGADIGSGRSWGVVDDTCDGIIEAQVVIDGVRKVARARIVTGPPDFAPDRRPFVSLADDLADRELALPDVDSPVTLAEIADLFRRVFETVSLFNLDALRSRAISENSGRDGTPVTGLPLTDEGSMTEKDKPFADDKLIDSLGPGPAARLPLGYAAAASSIHGPLTDLDQLLFFLTSNRDRVRQIIRPPWGAFPELSPTTPHETAPPRERRDPRVERDQMHDMRMPPYMRDSDATALSITRRQYDTIMAVADRLRTAVSAPEEAQTLAAATPARRVTLAEMSPLRQRVRAAVSLHEARRQARAAREDNR